MPSITDTLMVGIQYPYLEMNKFVSKWKKGKEEKTEKDMRYNLYCCLVFNNLAETFAACTAQTEKEKVVNKKKSTEALMMSQVYYPEILDTHRRWWQACGSVGYADDFRDFVDAYYAASGPEPVVRKTRTAKARKPATPIAKKGTK